MADNRVKEIVESIRQDAIVSKAPSIFKTPFLALESIGEIEEEQAITLKADDKHPVMCFTLDYGDGEVYQVFVWGGQA